MTQRWSYWLMVTALLSAVGYAMAEQMTLTTYYPSPRGMYKELRTMDNTYLAVQSGGVGIGTTTAGAKLEVNGGVRLNTNAASPDCIEATRGTLWFQQDAEVGVGHNDRLGICAQVDGNFRWVSLLGF